MPLEFELSYAGISFIQDRGTIYCPEMKPAPGGTNTTWLQKQEPEKRLIDELNKHLNFRYINDFVAPLANLGRNLDAIAYPHALGPMPGPGIEINEFFYPNMASRWSVFRGLATSAQASAMVKKALAKGGSAKPFIMKAALAGAGEKSEAQSTIKTDLYMLPPRTLSEGPGTLDGFFLITLVDERYFWQGKAATLNPKGISTWAGLISDLATALEIQLDAGQIDSVYLTPEPDSQLWAVKENAAVLLDAVLLNIGRVLVRNLDGSYTLEKNSDSVTKINQNRGAAGKVVRFGGGDMFHNVKDLPSKDLRAAKNAIAPTEIVVGFPFYVVGNAPVPHFLNPRYEHKRPSCWLEDSFGAMYHKRVTLEAAGITDIVGNGTTDTLVTTAKALIPDEASTSDEDPSNKAILDALAVQLAKDRWNYLLGSGLDECYGGIVKWAPEGINDIIWTFSEDKKQASTRVVRQEWNQLTRSFQHASGVPPKGVGGPSVAQTWRDIPAASGGITTSLAGNLASGGFTLSIANPSFLPVANRWQAVIDPGFPNEEVVYLEGTSGQTSGITIVYRGDNGTAQAAHTSGATLNWLMPNTAYGVNLVSMEKMQAIFPAARTSGGISEVSFVPQTQTVTVHNGSGILLGGIEYWSGNVQTHDASLGSGANFTAADQCWVVERNGRPLTSGARYDGQWGWFSTSGPVRPIYLVNHDGPAGTGGKNLQNASYTMLPSDWTKEVHTSSGGLGASIDYTYGMSGASPALPDKFYNFVKNDRQNEFPIRIRVGGTTMDVVMPGGGGWVFRSSGGYNDQMIQPAWLCNDQTGSNYAIKGNDHHKLITLDNASAVAVQLPQAGDQTFPAGWMCMLFNKGNGTVTITPVTSTINGGTSLIIEKEEGVTIVSDGTNYCAAYWHRPGGLTFTSSGSHTVAVDDWSKLLFSSGGGGTNHDIVLGTAPDREYIHVLNSRNNDFTLRFKGPATNGSAWVFPGGGAAVFNGIAWQGYITDPPRECNDQSGGSYTMAPGDCKKLVRFTSSTGCNVTLPQASETGGFPRTWNAFLFNHTDGVVLITPTTSTINGRTQLILDKEEGALIVSDGTNYCAAFWKRPGGIHSQRANYTATIDDWGKVIYASGMAGAITFNFPGTLPGRFYGFVKNDATNNAAIRVQGAGSDIGWALPNMGVIVWKGESGNTSGLITGQRLDAPWNCNDQTGTTYTIRSNDHNKIVSFNNANAVAATLAQASNTGNFPNGWRAWFYNKGEGTVTITPTTSTINGAATLVLRKFEGAMILSDGTNYCAVAWCCTRLRTEYSGGGMGPEPIYDYPYSGGIETTLTDYPQSGSLEILQRVLSGSIEAKSGRGLIGNYSAGFPRLSLEVASGGIQSGMIGSGVITQNNFASGQRIGGALLVGGTTYTMLTTDYSKMDVFSGGVASGVANVDFIIPSASLGSPFYLAGHSITENQYTVRIIGEGLTSGAQGHIFPGGGIHMHRVLGAVTNTFQGAFIEPPRKCNDQTGTSYTFLTTDHRKLVTFNNAAATAVTLPKADEITGFPSTWYCFVFNKGDGTVTITPTTSTIGGQTTLVLNKGEGALIVSDGSNYCVATWGAGSSKSYISISGPFVSGNSENTINNDAGALLYWSGNPLLVGTDVVVSGNQITSTVSGTFQLDWTLHIGISGTGAVAGFATPSIAAQRQIPGSRTWQNNNFFTTASGDTGYIIGDNIIHVGGGGLVQLRSGQDVTVEVIQRLGIFAPGEGSGMAYIQDGSVSIFRI